MEEVNRHLSNPDREKVIQTLSDPERQYQNMRHLCANTMLSVERILEVIDSTDEKEIRRKLVGDTCIYYLAGNPEPFSVYITGNYSYALKEAVKAPPKPAVTKPEAPKPATADKPKTDPLRQQFAPALDKMDLAKIQKLAQDGHTRKEAKEFPSIVKIFEPHAKAMREYALKNPVRETADLKDAVYSGQYRRAFEYTNNFYFSVVLFVSPPDAEGRHKMARRFDTSLPFWFTSATFIGVQTGNAKAVHGLLQTQKIEARYKTLDHAYCVGWRILKDFVDAQLASVSIKQMELAQAFLGFALDGKTGKTAYQIFIADRQKLLEAENK